MVIIRMVMDEATEELRVADYQKRCSAADRRDDPYATRCWATGPFLGELRVTILALLSSPSTASLEHRRSAWQRALVSE